MKVCYIRLIETDYKYSVNQAQCKKKLIFFCIRLLRLRGFVNVMGTEELMSWGRRNWH